MLLFPTNISISDESVLYILKSLQTLIDQRKETDFKEKLILYLFPLILIIGLIGNSLNILIFSKKTVRSNSTFRFLLYLSIFDLLVLLVCTPDVFLRFGYQIHIRQISIYTCHLKSKKFLYRDISFSCSHHN